MLKKVSKKSVRRVRCRVAIVASKYNQRYVNSMVKAAGRIFKSAGAMVDIYRVPGAFEIPVVAATLAAAGQHDVLICLGVILRGATTHAQHIGDAVTGALVRLQIDYHLPVINEVLLLENEQQAKERCLNKDHNRGREAALTALEMAALMKQFPRTT